MKGVSSRLKKDTGWIDQDHPAFHFGNPALEHEIELAVLVQEMRLQPVAVGFDQRQIIGEIGNLVGNAQFFDPVEARFADGQQGHLV